MTTRLTGLAIMALAALQASPAQTSVSMRDYLEHDGRFQIFLALAKSTGVDQWFTGDSLTGCTLVVPTDRAFAQLPKPAFDELDKNRDALLKVMQYHVLLGRKSSTEIGLDPRTVEGEALDLTGGVPIRTALFINRDVVTPNGDIQVIDQVLFPPAVFLMLQRDGAIPIGYWTGPHHKMTAAGIVTNPFPAESRTNNNSNKNQRRSGRWVRIPGTNQRVYVPAGG